MSLDQHLPETLRRTAEEHSPPFPDLASIVDGGRRRKRRRDVRRASVAAACLAVVAALPFVVRPFTTESTAPTGEVDGVSRVTDLPAGDVPGIPHCSGDRTIRGAGDPIDAACDVLIHRGGTTLFLNRDGVNRVEDGRLTLLDPRDWSSWYPALSLDGRWAAWVTETPDGPDEALLLGFDLQTGEQVAEEPWPTGSGWVPGIDDLGRVYFQDYDAGDITLHDLRTGDTIEVSGLPDHQPPSGLFVKTDGFGIHTDDGEVVVGSVTADGRFTQQHAVQHGWGTSFAPDRSRMTYERDGRLVVAPATGDGRVVPLRLPRHGEPVWFPVWESPESVLVQFNPEATDQMLATSNGHEYPARRTWLLRCYAADGACEVALPAGWGDRATWPVYR